jgi:enamine deaminase RidA (YjgF/YER057c/UK114 family)
VFKNLKLALDAAGATMADIVKMNTYLVAEVGQDDVPKLRAIRERYSTPQSLRRARLSSSAAWRGRAG